MDIKNTDENGIDLKPFRSPSVRKPSEAPGLDIVKADIFMI
jgi:hypothetical protein